MNKYYVDNERVSKKEFDKIIKFELLEKYKANKETLEKELKNYFTYKINGIKLDIKRVKKMTNGKALKLINQYYRNKGLKRINIDPALLVNIIDAPGYPFKDECMYESGYNVFYYFDENETYYIKNNRVILNRENETIDYLIKYECLVKL